MKTLKIFLLCFIAVFTLNTVNAQNRVVKAPDPFLVQGPDQFVPCTGDYLYGLLTFEAMYMKNNIIYKLKNGSIQGYKEPDGNGALGNLYEVSEINPGFEFHMANRLLFRLNGKLIAVFHIHCFEG